MLKEEIKSGEDYAITISGYQDGSFQSTLQINNLQPHHFAKYYCEARNNRGDDGLIIHLLKESHITRSEGQSNNGRSVNKDNNILSFTVFEVTILAIVVCNYSIQNAIRLL